MAHWSRLTAIRPSRRPPSRPRQAAMIIVFDLGGPLLAYALLRSAGLSPVTALVLSGVLPALGIAISALAERRMDLIGAVVLAGIAVGPILGLTSHDARLYLLEGPVPSVVFALGCPALAAPAQTAHLPAGGRAARTGHSQGP
jgi:hypothetical protein